MSTGLWLLNIVKKRKANREMWWFNIFKNFFGPMNCWINLWFWCSVYLFVNSEWENFLPEITCLRLFVNKTRVSKGGISGNTGNKTLPSEGAGGGLPNAAQRVGAKSVCWTSRPCSPSSGNNPALRYAKNAAVRSVFVSPPWSPVNKKGMVNKYTQVKG